MGKVRARFMVDVEVDADEYAAFASPATAVYSDATVQSWLSQNYFERLGGAVEVGDRPAGLTWSVDTIADPILDTADGRRPGYRDFL